MKEKLTTFKAVGTEISSSQQKNILGGYDFIYLANCFQGDTHLGMVQVSGRAILNPLGACRHTWPQTTRATLIVA